MGKFLYLGNMLLSPMEKEVKYEGLYGDTKETEIM